ncbi:hypothetical protein M406DRAFT_338999 [Cryphonectria parasitica EP155]|uniref:Alternative oxidase n=1 Tax=Cryphonectria parasitica (strain ATCC 38755 / EP155) TaxID=660469 RepID=A0A9P4Y3Q2_CRYP1|nr:uncharacterized protein M406DRAFT_338999 [Cryphonectria parasitica EP155]KAF3765570.1 hypothetical protein M406DRAFT_338999 [Cryphonectria parasitica EP155]
MLYETRPWVVILLAAALVLIWSFGFDVHDQIEALIYGQEPGQQNAETAFLQQAIRPGLLFTCEGQHGGIGMLRNQILKCVRYAIHGGGALVVPSMALRNANDLSDISGPNEVPLEYLMDREAFITHLTEGCPGMRIYNHVEDFPFYEQRATEPLPLLGDQFEPDHPREGLQHPREWRRNFDEWLRQQNVQVRREAPVHIKMEQSYLEYPVRDDGDAASHEFGKILSFRNDTRALAAKVLYELQQRHAPTINPASAINPDAYFGAHLRLEKDAVWAWDPDEWRFSRMRDQFAEHFRYLDRTGLGVVYVACGNQTVVEMFADSLRRWRAGATGSSVTGNTANTNNDVTVVTKYDLLQGADLRRLEGMTFDQQALVDFLIMFKASAFMGVAHSSFSWNVALRRHELSKYASFENEGSDLLRDEYSIIMGMEADYPRVDGFKYAIWP